jgi:hypothetical protein
MTAPRKPVNPTRYEVTIEGLREAFEDTFDIFVALKKLPGFTFSEEEKSGMERLKRFTLIHSDTIERGGEPDNEQVHRTIRLAQNLGDDLVKRFENYINGAPAHFDRLRAEISGFCQEVLNEGVGELLELQENFRNHLAQESEYEEVAEAYTAVSTFLHRLLSEAKARAEEEKRRERSERRREKRANTARSLKELAHLVEV